MFLQEEQPLNFSSWMLFSLPGGFINLFILWIVLQLYFLRPSMKEFFGQCKAKTKENNTRSFKDMIKERYEVNIVKLFWFFIVLRLFRLWVLSHSMRLQHCVSSVLLSSFGFSGLYFVFKKFKPKISFYHSYRKPGFMPGWTNLFNWEGDISIATATPTLLIVVLFFIIPADYKNPK